MRVRKTLKLIKKSKVLTKKEKRELIIKGIIEEIVNFYKTIIKLPFMVIGLIFCFLGCIFGYIVEGIELIEQVFRSITIWLEDKVPELCLTKNQAREKLLAEIRNNTFKVN